MKAVISVHDVVDFELEPEADLSIWQRLVAPELRRRWADRSEWAAVACPCCGGAMADPAFEHAGFAYVECRVCGSAYAPRRPDEATLVGWYRESAAARHWQDYVRAVNGEARLAKTVRARARWVLDGIAAYAPHASRLVDVSADSRALVERVAAGAPPLRALTMAGPTADLEGNSAGRVTVAPTSVARLPDLAPADVVTALDALGRAADVPALVAGIRAMLPPGGLLFATVPVASGFEFQTLWERSPSALPPDRLNLPSIDGLHWLFSARDWELLELSTTAAFELDVVRRAMADAPEAAWPRVARALAVQATAEAQHAFTAYLQSQCLTSSARLVARRKAG